MAFSFTLGGSSTYIFYYITGVRENLWIHTHNDLANLKGNVWKASSWE